MKSYNFTSKEWESCLKVLSELKDKPLDNPDNQTFGTLISKIHKNAKKQNRSSSYKAKRTHDLQILKSSKIAQNALNNTTEYNGFTRTEQSYETINIPKNCYSCNAPYNEVHSFYNRLCPTCAELNYANRFASVDLSSRNVIITGGRVKIGYATALRFLRSHANVLVTTRFPASALALFKKEKDYNAWSGNLTIYGLDLKHLKSVEDFISYYTSHHDSLDILINNAAQTIKYSDQYYEPIVKNEQELLLNYGPSQQLIENKTPIIQNRQALASVSDLELKLNRFGQPVDLSSKNSWNSTLEDVSMYELVEVNLINQISPYFLIKELTPLMKASAFKQKFIINVTSSEGQFSYTNKTVFHPHTNMTKAALNMLTRTSAKEYEGYNICMSAVDVGWVSTGAIESLREKQYECGYIPPLDPVDGASRIIHPIIETLTHQKKLAGKLLKNYRVESW
ncbi:SDR family oxidoreductase [uncultured Psychroserpens sp.]|uniref:SDR family oxidoreductase n=1 Tax=uncultured Psychroserpens sp. TaxID=255436 RepID=UPI00262E16F5|nr:SDR family oxidoreductase [uncultured Psychroserpens sp.]